MGESQDRLVVLADLWWLGVLGAMAVAGAVYLYAAHQGAGAAVLAAIAAGIAGNLGSMLTRPTSSPPTPKSPEPKP